MAAEDSEASSNFGFLARKLGPLPVWVWAVGVVAAYYWYTHYGPGANSGTTTASGNANSGSDQSITETSTVKNGPVTVSDSNTTNPPASPPSAPPSAPPPAPPRARPPSKAATPVNEILQGGHVISANPGKAEVGWTIAQQTPLAKSLKVVVNGPGKKNFTRVIPANATNATVEDLEPGHGYNFAVTPLDSAGQAIGGPNNIWLVTSGGRTVKR